jgi:hypothetical protein
MWGPPGSEGREDRGHRFGAGRCWAMGSFWLWAGMVPGAQFHIFLFFAFFFLFLSQILQKCSKSIQATFRDFAKITARFQVSRKTSFQNQNKFSESKQDF